MNPPLIQFQNITKIFNKKVILDNVNLDIPYGEIFGIIGKSGSGKTTLLSILVGFLKPERGKVFFQSQDLSRFTNNIRQQFGFTAQEGSFYPNLTVRENLEYFGTMYNVPSFILRKKIPEILKLVNLAESENKLAAFLSSGMKKRLDIACAILHDPKVLILDEPTEDLDPILRKDILRLLKRINKEKNVTIILTTHLLDEIEYVCTRVAILDKRTVLVSGTASDLKDKYSKNQEIILQTYSGEYKWLMKLLEKNKLIEDMVERDGRLIIYSPKAEGMLRFILHELEKKNERVQDVDLNKPSLSEVFESLTQEDE